MVAPGPEGQVLYVCGRPGPAFDEVRNQLDTAVELAPAEPIFHHYRVKFLIYGSRFGWAKRAFGEALEATDTSPRTWDRLVELLNDCKEYESLVDFLTQLHEAHSDDVQTIASIGVFLVQLERYSEAEPRLEEAYAAWPEDAMVLENLGIVRAEQGDFDSADELYQDALRLDADWTESTGLTCRYADFVADDLGEAARAEVFRTQYGCTDSD